MPGIIPKFIKNYARNKQKISKNFKFFQKLEEIDDKIDISDNLENMTPVFY